MGDWGPKVFDNDSACDYANDVAVQFIRNVEENLPRLEEGDVIVTSSVAMLCTLANEFPNFRFSISKARATRWQHTYLNWFDANYPDMVGSSNLEAFRTERLGWFTRLAEIADGDDDIDEAIDERRGAEEPR